MVNGEYLSVAEGTVLENPALLQRARAIQAFLSHAALIGLGESEIHENIDTIRTLDKKSAKRLRKNLLEATGLLSPAPSDTVHADLDVSVDSSQVDEHSVGVSSLEESPEPIVPIVTEDTGEMELLSASVQTWLQGITNENVSTFSRQDVPEIVKAVLDARGPVIQRSNSVDYESMLTDFLNGSSLDELAERCQKSYGAISQALSTSIKAKLLKRQGGKVQLLTVVHSGTADEEGVSFPTEAVPSIVAKPTPPMTELRYVASSGTAAVMSGERQSVVLEEGVLERALLNPDVVSKREWEQAAKAQLFEYAKDTSLTDSEAGALWQRLHFDASGACVEEVTSDSKEALRCLQQLFFERGKDRLKDRPRENVGVRTLVVMANGVKTLTEVCDKIRQLKGSETLTNRVAERYVVAGVLELLKPNE